MDLKFLKEKTLDFIKKYPELKSEFTDFYYLAISEIEEGGSEQHECELAYNDMLDVVENYENERFSDDPSYDLMREEERNWIQEQREKERNN